MDLPGITEVKRLTLRPGDRLVVRIDRQLGAQEFEELRRHVRKTLDEVIGPEPGGM